MQNKNVRNNTKGLKIYEFSKDLKLEKHDAVMENSLIEARYNLTIEEQRLILTTIAVLDNLEIADNGFPLLKIPKKLIIRVTGLHKKDYKVIKNALKRLMSRVIEIEDENGFVLYQWFAKAKYNKGEEFIEVQFHSDLLPYLLRLKERFTRIPLKQVLKLRSKYAIRLYELLKRYEDTGYRQDKVVDLRKKLGISENGYKLFKDFEKRVLKQAVREINKETDLEVTYKKKKTGRKITHIEFFIKTKNTNSQDVPLEEEIKKLTSAVVKVSEADDKDVKRSESHKEKTQSKYDNWEEIRVLRKKYSHILSELSNELKRLTENQVLFLLLNLNKDLFPDNVVKEIILTADKNEALKNPMGFLIQTFQIDMNNARYKELTLTVKKIDEELWKEKLKELFIEENSAIEYMKEYWKNASNNKKINKDNAYLLKEPLKKAIYDGIENKIYIPVLDSIHKDWFEINFLEDIKEFVKQRFNIDDVEVIVLENS